MIELEPDQFPSVMHLFRQPRPCIPPLAVAQGRNPGRVFVDRLARSSVALVWTPCGFMFLAGSPRGVRLLRSMRRLIGQILIPAIRDLGEVGIVLYPLSTLRDWQVRALLAPRSPMKVYRRGFGFHPESFRSMARNLGSLPPGFRLQRVDASVIGPSDGDLPGTIRQCWGTRERFLRHGFGYAVMHGEHVASFCAAAFVADEGVAIGVDTAAPYRRRGFGTLVCHAFVEHCLSRGILPDWECFWDNQASDALARKLGFQATEDRTVHYWEERA